MQRTTFCRASLFAFRIVLSNAVLRGWVGGPTALQALWQQQGAHSREDKVCSVWRCQALGTQPCCSQRACDAACGLTSGSSTFLTLVSQQTPNVSKLQVSLLSEKDITSKYLLQDLLITFPHLYVLPTVLGPKALCRSKIVY